MALFHVHAYVITKGHSKNGSAGFAQYLQRESPDKASQFVRYMGRDGHEKDDLVAKGHGALPTWAKGGTDFFLMADRHERKGGAVGRCYEIALPQELSPAARLELAADIRDTFFEHVPHVWAVHNPVDRAGREHPHMHLMMSERGQTDQHERTPKQYFSRAASPGQDPATHGVRKDRSWQGPARLREVRAGVALLTNAALEREGLAVAVSHESLRARGHDRAACIYTKGADRPAVEVRRDILHRDYHPFENDLNLAAWHTQKQREGIQDLSRTSVIEHVRNRAPTRAQERSMPRDLDRAVSRERTPERAPTRDRSPTVAEALERLKRGRALDDEPTAGAALRVRLGLHDREQEQDMDRGMGF